MLEENNPNRKLHPRHHDIRDESPDMIFARTQNVDEVIAQLRDIFPEEDINASNYMRWIDRWIKFQRKKK